MPRGFKHTIASKIKIGNASRGRPKTLKEKKYLSKIHRGKNCNFWKGGKSKKCSYKHITDLKWKIWRMQIFTRDNFTCQVCLKVGVYLQAHHIKKWSEYKKLRYDVNNGITLCKECHYKIHKKI